MDGVHESERTSVYHVPDLDTTPDPDDEALVLVAGRRPRLFVLVQDVVEIEDEVAVTLTREVVAYGIALPDGAAATVSATGQAFGRWQSPESASRRLSSELVWLAP
jgi:hypothetical protein